jgi:hypothetical protein
MEDIIVNLIRMSRNNQGTIGILSTPFGFQCHTLELPWRDNQKNISCIPPGEYQTKIRISPKYGKVYHVQDVPNRTFILIHSGNWAGDVNKGYRTHVNGCILLGLQRGLLDSQIAVLNSRLAVSRFIRIMNYSDFTLNIIEKSKGGN